MQKKKKKKKLNHLILCHPLLLLPSVFPSIRVYSNELVLHIRWPKYWSFSTMDRGAWRPRVQRVTKHLSSCTQIRLWVGREKGIALQGHGRFQEGFLS